MPEGIAITFGQDMIKENGGLKTFLQFFHQSIETEDCYWMHKCSNLPTKDIDHIYIIVCNRLYGRVYNGGFRRGGEKIECYRANSNEPDEIDWAHINLAGPFERCPFKRTLKGFQGFRYTTKLF